ncbi:MAG: sigma 54-interacting transcriptional regulator [Gemmatimonadota bacterium]|nr:MAG: sigma 54-interacting transcriptional regulator [Gemmatimonadota bacterium]
MDRPEIVVMRLSDSFSDVWGALADDLGASLAHRETAEVGATSPGTAALVLSAGGAEREALEWLEGHDWPVGVPLFVVGADAGRRTATQVVTRGASDYFVWPEDLELSTNALAAAVERRSEALRRAAAASDQATASVFAEIVGESPELKEVLSRAARVLAHSETTILITGETGTGKELLAAAIHNGSDRRGSPFVAVNCSALPDNLIESELFGHERGAFTDAHTSKPGLFEVAEGGTLFLDEIGTLPPALQAKLLRVLQDKKVRRVGGTKARVVDVRIIAATNEDLRQALKDGSFRQDLYFRLGVITLSLPPLRERGDDVVLIAESILQRLATQHGLPAPHVRPEVRRALLAYHWPGNVRELKNAVERALLLSHVGELDAKELLPQADLKSPGSGPIPFPAQLDEITTAAARATLGLCNENRSEAARRLGISRRRLRRLLEDEGVPA